MPNKTILVAGSSRPFSRTVSRAARMVAMTLIENRFDLVTGNATGVDRAAAAAYCFELARRQQPLTGVPEAEPLRYTQLRLRWWNRGSLWPLPGYRARGHDRLQVRKRQDWLEEARSRADAVVMIGGSHGSLAVANRFIESGKPVFPVPFTGGRSNDVYREILRNWCDHPVPGLSRSQFLRLSVPWVTGTGALADLLLGTLQEHPDIFVSYRRTDSDWITGRLRSDLSEHFGSRRVFMDIQHIEPGQVWQQVLTSAIARCRVGVVVIAGKWFDRIVDNPAPDDVLVHEIRTLLDSRKPIIPVLTPDAPVDRLRDLPQQLSRLADYQAVVLTNAAWDQVLQQIIRTIRPYLRAPQPIDTPASLAGAATGPGSSSADR